jgi:hypothetical protein
MKRRDNKEGKYYCISNPTEANIHTGNFCVSYNFIKKFDKDFLFDWIDPVDGEHIEKVLKKEFVLAHCKPIPKWMYDELELKYKFKGLFYLISFKDIYQY